MTADALVVAEGVEIPLDELSWRFSPPGGPGGQHANTANTRAEVSWSPASSPGLPAWAAARIIAELGPTVSASAGERRSQLQNRQLALARLAKKVAGALQVAETRRPTRPTPASQRRRVEAKRRRSQLKRERRSLGDYPE